MRVVYADLTLTSTISIPEVLWTGFTFIGWIFSFLLLRRAVGDLYFLRAQKINHYREFAATTTIWIFATLSTMQLVYTVIGIIAMCFPAPDNQVSPQTIAVMGIFIVTSFMFDVMAGIINARKNRLIEMIAEDIEQGEIDERATT